VRHGTTMLKDFRIDPSSVARKSGRAGITANDTSIPARPRLMMQRPSRLLDLSPIFGSENTSR
jgi:hypothetical protein